MITLSRRLLLASPALPLAGPARAHHDTTVSAMTIGNPWARAAGANTNGAAYMTPRNAGGHPDRLVSASTPIARTVELHTHIRHGAVMRMRPVADIPVPAGQTVRLRPGGLHVMLIGLTEPLRQGATVPLTLRFERTAVPAVAFLFAAIACAGVWLLGGIRGATPGTPVLAGIALMFLFPARLALLQFMASPEALLQIVFWLFGSLQRATWPKLAVIAAVLAVAVPLLLREPGR